MDEEAHTTFTAPLSPALREFAEQIQACFPSSCPWCGWKHPREMFKRDGETWRCMKCGEAISLLTGEQEDWPDNLEA